VVALVDLVEVDEVGIGLLGPTSKIPPFQRGQASAASEGDLDG